VSNWQKIVFILTLLFLFGSRNPVFADDCGYIQMNPNGKGLVYGKTDQLFVPLGWKETYPWWWKNLKSQHQRLATNQLDSFCKKNYLIPIAESTIGKVLKRNNYFKTRNNIKYSKYQRKKGKWKKEKKNQIYPKV
jgi:hypothetical protein